MKRIFCLIVSVCLLLSLFSCASRGGELQKRPGTVENNRVIGAEDGDDKAPASTAAPSEGVPGSSAPPSTAKPSAPLATQQSGTAKDQQELSFRLRLEWATFPADDGIVVNTQLFLDCYSLAVNSSKSGFVSVNGVKRSFRTDKIAETDNTLHSIPIASESFTVALADLPPEGIAVEAQWNFNGTYAGQDIEALTLQEIIEIG